MGQEEGRRGKGEYDGIDWWVRFDYGIMVDEYAIETRGYGGLWYHLIVRNSFDVENQRDGYLCVLKFRFLMEW